MSTGPAIVSSGKRIEDVAADYKEELRQALSPAIAILNRAAQDSIVINFSIPRDQHGRYGTPVLDAVKPL